MSFCILFVWSILLISQYSYALNKNSEYSQYEVYKNILVLIIHLVLK